MWARVGTIWGTTHRDNHVSRSQAELALELNYYWYNFVMARDVRSKFDCSRAHKGLAPDFET